MTVGTITDIKIEDVLIDHGAVSANGLVPVEITVKNTGMTEENAIDILVDTNSGTSFWESAEVSLAPGETCVVSIELPMDEEVSKNTEYNFMIMPMSGDDYRPEDNSKIAVIGYTDLQLTAEMVKSEEKNAVLVTVDNISCIDTNATLRVREHTVDGDILASYFIGNISAFGSETMEINEGILPAMKDGGKALCFEVIALEEELYCADNSNFVYLESKTNTDAVVNVLGLGETVTLKGKDYSGKIIVAIYDENDKLISTYHYTPEDTVNYNGNKDYSYAKVMWWEGASFMKPMCRAVVTEK